MLNVAYVIISGYVHHASPSHCTVKFFCDQLFLRKHVLMRSKFTSSMNAQNVTEERWTHESSNLHSPKFMEASVPFAP